MFGKGLIKGLSVTGKQSISKRMTEKYPEEKPYLSECFRGGNFQLNAENCIGCGLCVRACPNQVLEVVTEKDEDGKKRVTEYWVDRQYCLYCGFCIDACTKKAIRFTMDFENAVYSRFDVPVNLIEHPHLDEKASTYGMNPAKPGAPPKPAAKAAVAKAESEPARDMAAVGVPAENPPAAEKGVE